MAKEERSKRKIVRVTKKLSPEELDKIIAFTFVSVEPVAIEKVKR